jgi:hypothetical protein
MTCLGVSIFHLVSMYAETLHFRGTCSIIYRDPWSFATQPQSLSTVWFLKSLPRALESNTYTKFLFSVKIMNGFTGIRKSLSLSVASTIGKASFSSTLQSSCDPLKDPLKTAKGLTSLLFCFQLYMFRRNPVSE